jgi:hypothetical protein
MEIREKLKHGDIPVLAEMAGVALSTAKKTIQGGRKNPRVLEAARLLVESRESIKRQLNP